MVLISGGCEFLYFTVKEISLVKAFICSAAFTAEPSFVAPPVLGRHSREILIFMKF